jgi:hypothetical protein
MTRGNGVSGKTDIHIPANSGIDGFSPKEKIYMTGSQRGRTPDIRRRINSTS